MKKAFTLAEVLITLGIIGIVAALVLPNAINTYQKHVTVNKLRIALQYFTTAIQEAINEYSSDGKQIYIMDIATADTLSPIAEKYIDPYIKGAEKFMNIKESHIPISNANKTANSPISYYKFNKSAAPMCTPKGFCYWLLAHTNNYTYLIVDLNGPTGPNVMGRDVFAFDIASKYVPGKGRQYITLPQLYHLDNYSNLCNKTSTSSWNGMTCASKIMYDNWQIKDDYPWY